MAPKSSAIAALLCGCALGATAASPAASARARREDPMLYTYQQDHGECYIAKVGVAPRGLAMPSRSYLRRRILAVARGIQEGAAECAAEPVLRALPSVGFALPPPWFVDLACAHVC